MIRLKPRDGKSEPIVRYIVLISCTQIHSQQFTYNLVRDNISDASVWPILTKEESLCNV